MLYTRSGDDGTSSLFGGSTRLPKHKAIFEALGGLDELNSHLGLCRAHIDNKSRAIDMTREVLHAQEVLFIAQAELAGAAHHVLHVHTEALEHAIARIEERIARPHSFIIPGSTATSAHFDVARAVCRRAERAVVSLADERAVSPSLISYLNRLSSLLYALARYAASDSGAPESGPVY
jgi:cob(I)alamin adenosyltransferase